MKLLFDQNISYRIIKKIEREYRDSGQVKRLGPENSTDLEIWEYARNMAFDSDFMDIANLKGYPPKIIWLRTGTTTTTDSIANLLLRKVDQVTEFLNNP